MIRFDEFCESVIKLGKADPNAIKARDELLGSLGYETELNNEIMTEDGVFVSIGAFGRFLRISHIQVPSNKMGMGLGNKVMKRILEVADKYNVPVSLTASPIGDSGMDRDELVKWYGKFGFVLTGEDTMVRELK